MIMRATCHHEVCGTCSQEEGSLQPSQNTKKKNKIAAGSIREIICLSIFVGCSTAANKQSASKTNQEKPRRGTCHIAHSNLKGESQKLEGKCLYLHGS